MMRKIFDQLSDGGSQFFFMVFQPPTSEIRSFINTLEIDDKTFLIDLIINFMYEHYENRFIDTIMTVPSHGFIDGLTPDKQIRHVGNIIDKWLLNTDLSSLTKPLKEIVHEFNLNGMYVEPIDASMNGLSLVVEFEAFLTEHCDENSG